MPSTGDRIRQSSFSTSFASYSNTFYATNQGYYVRSESWGMRAQVNSAFLNDWHGTCYVERWDGSGWTQIYSTYMQDTSARKSVGVKINANSLNISAASYYFRTADAIPNLWRIRFSREKWGGNKGVGVTFYIGSVGTCSGTLYDTYLKNRKIYSNGTIGKSQCGLWTYGNGWAGSNQDVLNYFASNKGTKIYASYDRYCTGAIRTGWS